MREAAGRGDYPSVVAFLVSGSKLWTFKPNPTHLTHARSRALRRLELDANTFVRVHANGARN